MKYKRQKTKVSKYISQANDKNQAKKSVLKKQVAASLALVTLMFSLSGLGLVKRPVIKNIFGYNSNVLKNFSVSPLKNSPFLKNAGEHIFDFCFGYLKEGDNSKTKAYALSKEKEVKDRQNMPKETWVNSDSAIDSAAQISAVAFKEAKFLPQWPCQGEVTSEFGERIHPVSGEKKVHNGIDIAADEGDKIFACEDGTIDTATYNEYSGNYVVISHVDGYTSVYCHMSELLVSQGMTVKKGDVIGLAGSTGIVTGPHLHFEIKLDGIHQNPQTLIAFQ